MTHNTPEPICTLVPKEAELTIMYNFYIDCMPSDDMAEASRGESRSRRFEGLVGTSLPLGRSDWLSLVVPDIEHPCNFVFDKQGGGWG